MKTMTDKEFGKQIRSLRKQRNLTIGELADKADISPSYLSQIETGNRSTPTDEILLRLSQGLNIDYSKMLDMAGRQTSAFDSHIRSFVHLLIGNREHPFFSQIELALEARISELINKHKVELNKKVTIHDENGPRSDIPEQYANMILDTENVQFKWDVLQELQEVAHEFHIRYNPAYELGVKQLRPLELTAIFNNGNVSFNGHLLNEEDLKRINDMLAVLFPNYK